MNGRRNNSGYIWALAGVAGVTALLSPFAPERANATTVALALLLVVLFVATGWGSRPAILSALLGMLCFNFFFLPPEGTLTIADPENWVALTAFLLTAITAGQLSASVRRRAEEAETKQREIVRLYQELQEAFEKASEAAALRRSEQLKSALLDAVTHDLRTPLTAIKASVTTLLEELRQPGENTLRLEQEDRREMLEVIDEETDRLNRFIENMVELARLEAGTLALQYHWGNVEDIVTAALQRAERVTQQHRLEVTLAPELPLVRADAKALAEVVYTLLDNACKYAPPGTRVRLSAECLAEDEMLRFTVEDEGPGIPPELRGKVFDKFFRATTEAQRLPANGLGMGLAIARGIVEAHGGKIWFEDGTGGRGTRVRFTVPIGDEEEPAAAERLVG